MTDQPPQTEQGKQMTDKQDDELRQEVLKALHEMLEPDDFMEGKVPKEWLAVCLDNLVALIRSRERAARVAGGKIMYGAFIVEQHDTNKAWLKTREEARKRLKKLQKGEE